jgi:hypothetical protein
MWRRRKKKTNSYIRYRPTAAAERGEGVPDRNPSADQVEEPKRL